MTELHLESVVLRGVLVACDNVDGQVVMASKEAGSGAQYGRPVSETAPFLEFCAARNGLWAAEYRLIWRYRGTPSRSARRPPWRPRLSRVLKSALVSTGAASHTADSSALAAAQRSDQLANAKEPSALGQSDASDIARTVSRLSHSGKPLLTPAIVFKHR